MPKGSLIVTDRPQSIYGKSSRHSLGQSGFSSWTLISKFHSDLSKQESVPAQSNKILPCEPAVPQGDLLSWSLLMVVGWVGAVPGTTKKGRMLALALSWDQLYSFHLTSP